ncbi:MAG: murein hydrolase activator EnvC [Acidimicrobiia bacterium]
MRTPRLFSTVLLLVVTALAIAGVRPVTAAAQAAPRYRPPVAGIVVDRFRPPLRPYGPGNLGIDYRTQPDAVVVASAAGVVTFAGRVGVDLFVVIAHGDGLRTTYGFLRSASVVAGTPVLAGQAIGTSGSLMHFGVRRGPTYLDPERLLRGGQLRPRLVPNR